MKLRTAILAAYVALAACSGGAEPGLITREQFIRANAALRAVSDTVPDSDSLRARALRAEKVTAAQLQAWLRAHQDDPVLLAETWTEITRRSDASDPSRHAAKRDSIGPVLTHGPPPSEVPPATAPPPGQPPVSVPQPVPGPQPVPPATPQPSAPRPVPAQTPPPPPPANAPQEERPRLKKVEPARRDTVPARHPDSAAARLDSAGS